MKRWLAGFGLVALGTVGLAGGEARGQGFYGGYPGNATGYPGGASVSVGVGYTPAYVAPSTTYTYGYGSVYGGAYPAVGQVGYGYGGGGYIAPRGPSPAARQGYREGEYYYETGIAPNRPLSPAEARGFAAGERRAAATPWQVDPIRQQGYREGQLYWETGLAPNRPLTPAEAQGFQAGERRAAVYGYPNY